MLALLGTIAGMIPGISTIVTSLTSSYFNSKVAITQAKIGGDVTVATALVRAAATSEITSVQRLQVIGGSWVLSLLVVGFALPFIVWESKVIVWDIVLGWGSTPSIKDPMLLSWGGTIIACLFGSGTVLTAGHMYFNRKDQ
jgi:hypothetical protein